jgi:hypothetical protein
MAVKKTSLTTAAVVAISLAGGATSFAAQLPTYEVQGLPISPAQSIVLGGAMIVQAQVAPPALSPHQVSVLTPRRRLNTATDAAITTGAGH